VSEYDSLVTHAMRMYLGGGQMSRLSLVMQSVMLCLAFAGCQSTEHEAIKEERKQQEVKARQNTGAIKPPEEKCNWAYEEEKDPMHPNRVIRFARNRSLNEIRLPFPYEGSQRATLTLQSWSDAPGLGTAILISVERGQLLTNNMEVSFDNKDAISYWPKGGYNGQTNWMTVYRDDKDFLRRLDGSENVRIQVWLYQAGDKIFEFNVKGLKWEKEKQNIKKGHKGGEKDSLKEK
jgi:hypothetical protein